MADCAGERLAGRCSPSSRRSSAIAAALREHALDLVIANKNAPRQCVLSGPAAEIARGRRFWRIAGSRPAPSPSRRRSTAGSSPAAREPFAAALDAVAFAPATIPVFANATAAAYPDDAGPARDLLADQLARPVEFVAQVEAMYRMGARTFLEVGPDARLTGLVRSILERPRPTPYAVDASRGSAGNLADLACSLATLAALGYAVDLTRWDDGYAYAGGAGQEAGADGTALGANPTARDRPARRSAIAERVHRTGAIRSGHRPRLLTRDGSRHGTPGNRGHRPHPGHEITPRTIER